MKSVSKLICSISIVLLPLAAIGQTLSTFDSLGGGNYGGSWVTPINAISLTSGVATIGSPALADGNFEFADISAGTISLDTSLVLNYTARVDVGNLSNSFLVRIADTSGDYSLQALIVTTSWVSAQFVTGSAVLTSSGTGDASQSAYFTLSGDGSTNAFRMSFDSLSVSAIPEPSSYTTLFGVTALGACLLRRRRKAV
jgi:hypothetical protein